MIIVIAVLVVVMVAGAGFVTVSHIFSKGTTTSMSALSCAGQTVTIGYFPNVNHAQALIGMSNLTNPGVSFENVLGPSCTLRSQLFTSGPTEITALLANQIQIAFVGPIPAVTAYVDDGQSIRIVSGVASGGAIFVVTNASGITNANATGGIATLNGGTFGAPALGNTQDVALRTYLAIHHVNGTTIDDTSNSNLVNLLVLNKIDGAWLPQPYASLALFEAKAHVFLNEQSLWPGEEFSTAEIAVTTSYLSAHPDVVQKIVLANVEETLWINQHAASASSFLWTEYLNNTIYQVSGLVMNSEVLDNSIGTLSFTYDPLISSVNQEAQNAYALGYLGSTLPNLSGLFDLTYLNNALVGLHLQNVTN